VLEVGAGIGTTSKALCRGHHQRWICLEPDSAQVDKIRLLIEQGELPPFCETARGVLGGDAAALRGRAVDSVLYVDVLEHIENDRAELQKAAEHVAPSGYIVVMSPAHQWLYTEFDRNIGHYRRYDRGGLVKLFPAGGRIVVARYLDSVGLLASAGNRLFLRSGMPNAGQIKLWDRVFVPLSKRLDPLLWHGLGKSVLVVWQREPAPAM
jgi:hypothetical protein